LFLFCVLTLSSCFEIREEVYIKKNGSGSYSLLMDMGQIMPLIEAAAAFADSTQEDRNLETDISKAFAESSEAFEGMPGISNAKPISDRSKYQYGFSFEFTDVDVLNEALSQMESENSFINPKKTIFQYRKRTFERNLTGYVQNLAKELTQQAQDDDEATQEVRPEQRAILESATYSFHLRTQGKITSFSGEKMEQVRPDEVRMTVSLQDIADGKANLVSKVKFK
jgi:hypothetical protein